MTSHRKAVGITDLVDILGVKHQTIYEGIKSGRLARCVIGKDRQRKFEIYTACLEWDLGREFSQIRESELLDEAMQSSGNSADFPTLAESRQMKEYYEALNEQVTLLRQTGKLVELDAVDREIFNAARITRDRLQEIPEKIRFDLLSCGIPDQDTERLLKNLTQMIHEALLYVSDLDLAAFSGESGSQALNEFRHSVGGVRDA